MGGRRRALGPGVIHGRADDSLLITARARGERGIEPRPRIDAREGDPATDLVGERGGSVSAAVENLAAEAVARMINEDRSGCQCLPKVNGLAVVVVGLDVV